MTPDKNQVGVHKQDEFLHLQPVTVEIRDEQGNVIRTYQARNVIGETFVTDSGATVDLTLSDIKTDK